MPHFDQSPYRFRLKWGRAGARHAARRGDVIVVVDVFSFSTTAVTAVQHGALIYPYLPVDEARDYADSVGALMASKRGGGVSLSPLSFTPADAGKKYVLPSPNGSACAYIAYTEGSPAVFAGCFLNAEAVAKAAEIASAELNAPITVVPAGEHWMQVDEGDDRLRPALEDYLGAGAVLSYWEDDLSPESLVAATAFRSSRENIENLVWDCGSGRELRAIGFEADVTHAAKLNLYQNAPRIRDGYFA